MALILSGRRGIARQLCLNGGVALLAVAALACATFYVMGATSRSVQTLWETNLAVAVKAMELEMVVERHRRAVEVSPAAAAQGRSQAGRLGVDEVALEIGRLAAATADELPARLETLIAEMIRLGRAAAQDARGNSRSQPSEAAGRYASAADAVQRELQAFRAGQLQLADAQAMRLERNGRVLTAAVATLAVLTVLLVGPFNLSLVSGVANRLREITEAMGRLARNDTTATVESEDKSDEIGEMTRAVEVFKANAITLLNQKCELEQLNLWLDVALNNMARGLSMFDAGQRLMVCNATYARMYGLPDNLTQPGTEFRHIIEHRKHMVDTLEGATVDPGSIDATSRARKIAGLNHETKTSLILKNGGIFEVSIRPLESGGWVALHEDVTEQRRAAAQIAHLAHHDPLTGLSNRLQFREQLDQAARGLEGGEAFALHCLDLDRFKEVNDTFGHHAGDALLKAVAQRLEATVRKSDSVARLGGDEFAIIQRQARTSADAEALSKRLIAAASAPYVIHGHDVEIGLSIGVALAPGDGRDPDHLLRMADMALYRAKEEGRGRMKFFDPAMEGRLRTRRAMEIELQRAVPDHQLELHYQPILDLSSGEVAGCEALIRWRHPERGMVSPAEFIPIAEDTGLITSIGAWALETACRAAAQWPVNVKVAVNLSAAQFTGSDLVAVTRAALAHSGLDATRLELEVTESLILDEKPSTVETLHELRRLGVRIALDDFGTGYSSLSYLRRFPFDKIKIDQSFVRDLSQRQDCVAIVGAVAQLARSLSMATVAEGVETADHLTKVQAAGCTEVQGYLLSRPVPEKDVIAVMADCNRRMQKVASHAAA